MNHQNGFLFERLQGRIATLSLVTVWLFGCTVWLIGCAGPPTRTEPLPRGEVSLAQRAEAMQPELRRTEECGDRARIVALLEQIPKTSGDPLPAYLRARLHLALVTTYRFQGDHDLIEDEAAARQEVEANIAAGVAELDPILSSGRGESEHYRLHSDLIALRIESFLDGIRWGRTVQASLDEAERLDPENPWIALSLGKRRLFAPRGMGRDLKLARQRFDRAAELDPTWSEPYLYLSRIARLEGDDESARKYLERCRELQPDRRSVEFLLEYHHGGIRESSSPSHSAAPPLR